MSASAAAPRANGEILVVDDSAESLELLSALLDQAGYSVRQAPSGELALWSATQQPPDLIILDVRMPGMNGFDVCRCLKQQPATAAVPVIFLSATTDLDDKIEGFDAGGADFISKPFAESEALARVRTHIKMALAAKELLHRRQAGEGIHRAKPDSPASTPATTKEILVVEDTLASLQLLSAILGSEGYAVREAPNGELALWSAAKRPPDLILLDIRMPGMNGFDVCRCLKLDPATARVPVIFISALSDLEDKTEGFAAGAVDFIVKPFSEKEVLARVKTHLRLAEKAEPDQTGVSVDETHGGDRDGAIKVSDFERSFASSVSAIVLTDEEGRIAAVNPAFTRMTGFRLQDLCGAPLQRLVAEGTAAPIAGNWPRLCARGYWSGEVGIENAGHRALACQLSISILRDQTNSVSHGVAVLQDVSRKSPGESLIDFLAQHDPHTGLPTRALALSRFASAAAAAAANNVKLAVLVIKIETGTSFAPSTAEVPVNQIRQQIAARVMPLLDAEDTLYREDADHFVAIHTAPDGPGESLRLADQILGCLNADLAIDDKRVSLRASIGIAHRPADGNSLQALVDAATGALGQAGKSKTVTCVAQGQEVKFDVERGLRNVLAKRELELLFQPLVDLGSRRLAGAEALLRWNVSGIGTLLPSQFLSIAEETGEIVAIDAWVIHSVCAQLKQWRHDLPADFKIAINLSSLQFWQDGLLATVERALTGSEIPASCLEFDIAASTLQDDLAQAISILHRLKNLGVSLALDDFGSGPTNLAELRRLPIDCLKIDPKLLEGLNKDQASKGLVSSIAELAHNLRLKTLAKCIDRPELLDPVRACHCDLAQGRLLAPPVPAEAFHAQYLTNHGSLLFPDS